CPVCYETQPFLTRWLGRASEYVAIRRVPALSTEAWEPFAKLFYALETLGQADRLHWQVYDHFHFENVKLNDEKIMADWVARNGIERQRFVEVYGSSGVAARVAQARELLKAYDVRAGPVLGLCARRLVPTQALFSSLLCGGSCYQVDVTDAASLRAAAADFTERFGVPDIVIANAGISVGTSTESSEDLPAFRKIMDTNVFGMAATFQPFVLPMRARGSGTLVGIASVAGFRGLPGAGAYSASKSAAITYLESLRVELRGSGVAVVTICPGYIRTAMTASNRYRMPFIIDADEAARRFARVIARRRRFAVIPWQMALVSFALRHLPRSLFDRLFARAPRKARGLPSCAGQRRDW